MSLAKKFARKFLTGSSFEDSQNRRSETEETPVSKTSSGKRKHPKKAFSISEKATRLVRKSKTPKKPRIIKPKVSPSVSFTKSSRLDDNFKIDSPEYFGSIKRRSFNRNTAQVGHFEVSTTKNCDLQEKLALQAADFQEKLDKIKADLEKKYKNQLEKMQECYEKELKRVRHQTQAYSEQYEYEASYAAWQQAEERVKELLKQKEIEIEKKWSLKYQQLLESQQTNSVCSRCKAFISAEKKLKSFKTQN